MLVPSLATLKISIHAPVKGATLCIRNHTSSETDFNPRSREGSDASQKDYLGQYQNFNPRSREGSDNYERRQALLRGISIHAPVKGATNLSSNGFEPFIISIHAPVKGATGALWASYTDLKISIHAPVKGAT